MIKQCRKDHYIAGSKYMIHMQFLYSLMCQPSMCVCMNACMHACTCMHVNAWAYMCTHAYVCVYVCVFVWCVCVVWRVRACVRACVCHSVGPQEAVRPVRTAMAVPIFLQNILEKITLTTQKHHRYNFIVP